MENGLVRIVAINKVTGTERTAMLALHRDYFAHVLERNFNRDFEEKDAVIILHNAAGDIMGFSTLQTRLENINGVKSAVLFSGDTVVHTAYRHGSPLAGAFGHYMLRLIQNFPDVRRYWLLLTKGYRTYRFLPVFFKTFFPGCLPLLSTELKAIRNELCQRRFGEVFDGDRGVLKLSGQKDYLKPKMAEVPESKRNDPHVDFFLKSNPGYVLGDELACITEISLPNLNARAFRVIQSVNPAWEL